MPAVMQVFMLIRQQKAMIKQSRCIDSSPPVLPMIWGKTNIGFGDVQPTSNLNNTYVNKFHSVCLSCKQEITVPANECAGNPSSWQEHRCWLIACLCWRDHRFLGLQRRHWSRKIFIRFEKGMSSLWCLFKTFLQDPHPKPTHPPVRPAFDRAALRCFLNQICPAEWNHFPPS